jgi:hypothetical protein
MKQFLLATATVIALGFGTARAEPMLPYKSDWQTLEALDGSIYKIDQKSISHMSNGSAELIVYAVEGDAYNPTKVRRLWFDCRGRYQDHTGGISATLHAPPRSVAGQLSTIACAGARDARFDEPPKNAPRPEPQWTDYCKDFSQETCARIRKVVEAKVTPSYCKPGFAVVPTSLSNEQLRICYVMPPLKNAAAPASSQRASTSLTPSQPVLSPPAGATVSQTTPIKLAFRDCLISNGKTGDFTSKDGGKSAIMLMGRACKLQWDAWLKECVADGGTEAGPGGCTMQSGVLAQSTLLLLGK